MGAKKLVFADEARAGEQMAVGVKAWSNRTPRCASLSMLGVLQMSFRP